MVVARLARVFGSGPRPLFVGVATMAQMAAVRPASARMSGLRHGGQRRKDDNGAEAVATNDLIIEFPPKMTG